MIDHIDNILSLKVPRELLSIISEYTIPTEPIIKSVRDIHVNDYILLDSFTDNGVYHVTQNSKLNNTILYNISTRKISSDFVKPYESVRQFEPIIQTHRIIKFHDDSTYVVDDNDIMIPTHSDVNIISSVLKGLMRNGFVKIDVARMIYDGETIENIHNIHI